MDSLGNLILLSIALLFVAYVFLPVAGLLAGLILTLRPRTRRYGIFILGSGILGGIGTFTVGLPLPSSSELLGHVVEYAVPGFGFGSIGAIALAQLARLMSRLWRFVSRMSRDR